MKLDLDVTIGWREATAREMWQALWRLYRTCYSAGRGSGDGAAIDALYVCWDNLSPRWVDRLAAVAAAGSDWPLTIPASNKALRPLRRIYFQRLRRQMHARGRVRSGPRPVPRSRAGAQKMIAGT